MFVPINVAIYAAQYHRWDFVQALGSMRTICHVCNILQFSFQAYWFLLLLKLAAKVVSDWLHWTNGRGGDKSRNYAQNVHFDTKKEN